MGWFEAGLIVLWGVVVLVLVLVLAVARRVAQLTQLVSGSAMTEESVGLMEGESFPVVQVTTREGAAISSDGAVASSSRVVVAVLSTTCPSCDAQMPELMTTLRRAGRSGWRGVVAVVGSPFDGREMLARVDDQIETWLATGELEQPFVDALMVGVTPTIYLVEDANVVGRAHSVLELNELLAARMQVSG